MGGKGFSSLESERLVLRRFADSDLEPFLAYRNDPEVARYQSWDSCTESEASAMIVGLKSEQPVTPGEWFQFAIESKETGVLVGDCALKVEGDGRQAEVGCCTGSSPLRTRRTGPPSRCSSGWACAGKAGSSKTRGSRGGGPASTSTPC